jgi:5'-nucleotidase
VRILVTNDDGVDAPGIRPLAVALSADGHDVVVVAPTGDRSGSGAAIGKLFDVEPPEVVRHEWPELPGVGVHALDAPPATAVLAAALGAFGDPPDLVASGINPGANTGHLVIHSGTVGAALTAAGLDIPGLAVSMPWSTDQEYHWDTAAAFAVAAVDWVAKTDGGVPRVLNLNVPNLPIAEVLGVR